MSALKALASGLFGVGEITAENMARQAGKGIRRAVAPTAAAGGTAAIMKHKDKDHEKTAFWAGFEKQASVGSMLAGAAGKVMANHAARRIGQAAVAHPVATGAVVGGAVGAAAAGPGNRLAGAAGGAAAGAGAGAIMGRGGKTINVTPQQRMLGQGAM